MPFPSRILESHMGGVLLYLWLSLLHWREVGGRTEGGRPRMTDEGKDENGRGKGREKQTRWAWRGIHKSLS